jgi:hypothetical protein
MPVRPLICIWGSHPLRHSQRFGDGIARANIT